MEKRVQRSLLPGVITTGCAPDVLAESRRVVASARRRAAFRDAFDIFLLGCVDALFLRWPYAHLPLLDRSVTMLVLASTNALLLVWIWSARILPRWRAHRVAATWNPSERNQWINRTRS